MDDRAIFAIKDYMVDLFEPGRNWPKHYFRQRSYARWIVLEILNNIQNRPEIPPIQIVEEFVHKTDEFSGVDHDDKNDSFIFSTAHDIATDILDILRAMN
ncbi:MAG: hypothetical protein KH921_06990 [Erysipelotrichaceae bacterium]|nr:hypothetical protein [Erysipelotrichaceae bacterium]